MAQQNYPPTPPMIMPFPDGSRGPTAPNGGVLKTYDSEAMSTAVFSDAALHRLATTAILPDQCSQVDVTVDAYDPGGGRLASGSARIQVARVGAAAATLVGAPVMMTYTPLAAPWEPPALPFTPVGVEADLVVDPVTGTSVYVQVMGIAGTAIRWRATIRVIGAQAQQVT